MRILLVGDVMIGRLVNEVLKEAPPSYVWGDCLPVFERADLRVANLECVVSDRGRPWDRTPKAFHFRTDAKNIQVLKRAQVDLVSLANNHTLDYEREAMTDMLGILEDNGIDFAGAGADLEQAAKPVIRAAAGMKVGFTAFTDNEPVWEAKEGRYGVFYCPVDIKDRRAQRLLELVRKTAERTDFLIVSAHWGPNWGYLPEPRHVPFAHALVEAGADLVFGHSCHVVQGIEMRDGATIIYSAGNFIDDYAVDPDERNDRSFIFLVEAERHRVTRVRLYPTVISEFQARLARGDERRLIASVMADLCENFGTRTNWNEAGGYLEAAAPMKAAA